MIYLRQKLPNKRYQQVLLGVFAILLLGLIVLCLPGVQKKILTQQGAKFTDSFEIDYVHLLPWSLKIDGLHLAVPAAQVVVENIRAAFCPTKMLWRVIHLDELHVAGANIVLKSSNNDKPAGKFPGLFASVNAGYGMTVEQLSIDASLTLPDATGVNLDLPRGYLKAGDTGEIEFAIDVNVKAQNVSANTTGVLAVSQTDSRQIDAINIDLASEVIRESIDTVPSDGDERSRRPEPISLTVNAALTPWFEEIAGNDDSPVQTVLRGDKAAVQFATPAAIDGVTLRSDITFDADSYKVFGDYHLDITEAWLEQVIANKSAPLISESGKGVFEFDIAPTKLTANYDGDTRFTTLERLLNENPALPDSLEFNKVVALRSDLNNATVDTLQTSLTSNRETPLLSLGLSEAIELDLRNPLKLLDIDQTIAQFELLQIPVEWLDGVVPDGNLTDGKVSGRFNLETKSGRLKLVPEEALSVSATTITAKELPAQVIALSTQPSFSISRESFDASITQLNLVVGDESAASLELSLNLPLDAENPPMAVTAQGTVSLDRLKSLSILAPYVEQFPSPDGLEAALETTLSVHPAALTIKSVAVDLTRNGNPLVGLKGLQAFNIGFDDLAAIGYQSGALASVELNDIDLSWANPYLGPMHVAGALSQARFQLESLPAGGFALLPEDSLDLRRLTVTKDQDTLLQNIFLSVSPTLRVNKEGLRVDYRGLVINSGRKKILAGEGEVAIPRRDDEDEPQLFAISGRKNVNLNELSTLPFASAVASYEFGKIVWRTETSYDIEFTSAQIVARNFSATVFAGNQARVTAKSQGTTRIRPSIGPSEALAQHVIGDFDITISGVNSQEINDLIPLGGFKFKSFDGELSLKSDGEILNAEFNNPLHLHNASVHADEKVLINPFDVYLSGDLRTSGERLDAVVDEVKLNFASRPETAALAGAIKFRFQPNQGIPLQALDANLKGDLPVLLNQPIVLPGHSLSNGNYELNAQVTPNGDISGDAKFGNLIANEPLAVSEFAADIEGRMAANGQGFEFSMPIRGAGRTGQTDGLLNAKLNAGETKKALLELNFGSDTFYLNDLLASIKGISAPKPKKQKEDKKSGGEKETKVPLVINDKPDNSAFWNLLPIDASLDYAIQQLYYTDYVIFNNVSGRVGISAQKLTLHELNGFFHDSPLSFNGVMTFLEKTPEPYDVKVVGTVRDFNLSQFFTELVPGVKPRAEGLFGVSIDAFGQSPNIAQFRNELFFDVRLQSRDGLFRPLPPDGTLMIGASNALGIVGEGLSYMPTGGFGAGALSRLVNYIKEIDYDIIDVHLTRSESRDIVIEQALVQSPTVRMTAAGGIEYEYAKDVLDSPLTLDAQMNMSGKGAAILYSMDLLEDTQDDHGYYQGPKFEIRGNANEPTSNFAEIISAGAKGTVAGGVTRPISGLIGNIKHRWFGDDTKPADLESGLNSPAATPPNDSADTDRNNEQ